MNLLSLLNLAKKKLNEAQKPVIDAEILLCHLLNKDRIYIHCNPNVVVSSEIIENYLKLIEQRVSGRPLQYIIGEWEFYGLKFKVKEGVLIPRPDTELLVERCLELISPMSKPNVIDVGCGSGAISIAIAKHKTDAFVLALDIEDIPLEVTKQNSILNEVSDRVVVKKSDLLKNVDRKFENDVDLIVSNPPYIKEDEIKNLMVEVRDFEPRSALCGGEDGLYFYKEISKQAKKYLKNGGFIAYEIGYNQSEDVKNILLYYGYSDVKIYKDLAGLDRVVIAKKVDI